MTLEAGSKITVSAATKRGIAGLVADAERHDIVVTRRGQPVAAVLSMRRMAQVAQLAEDLGDLALVLAREASGGGNRTSLDQLIAAFGHTRESNRCRHYPMTSEARTHVEFTDDAIEDLRRLGPDAVPRVLKKLLMLEVDPEAGHPLGGPLTGLRKLVVAKITWRIVYRVSPSLITVCEIWAIGARRDSEVYRVAARRLAQASTDQPELTALADILAGRCTASRQDDWRRHQPINLS